MTDEREQHLEGVAERLVRNNVLCCLTGLVSTLAGAALGGTRDLQISGAADLCEQAAELCSPVLDYEEAARQAGWIEEEMGGVRKGEGEAAEYGLGWEDACIGNAIDPYEWEVYEHWAVTQWFAEKLDAAGERVDLDFAGLCVWARTTTGQAISMDGVVRKIAREML